MRDRHPRSGAGRVWSGVGVLGLLALSVSPSVGAESTAPRDARAGRASKPARARPVAGVAHVVRAGDSLWTIGRRYGVSLDALSHANGLVSGQRLAIGQRLTIPGGPVGDDRQEPPSLAEIVLSPPPAERLVPLLWPVPMSVASPFGPRGSSWHGGVDLRADRGTPIRAAAPGMVIASGRERGYGNVIKIWHADDLMTVYAHNHENHVRVGEWVERGRVIGTVGSTGRTTAPHLHFEVRLEGRKYNPVFWLPGPGVLDVATAAISPGLGLVR